MRSTSPAGRSILVVEDEPLIALDIEQTFAKAGAIVLPTRTLGDAHHLVEQNSLSAAVLDIRLCDGDSEALCASSFCTISLSSSTAAIRRRRSRALS
jgi:DNA-binding response OmpR family regulator